MAHGFASSGDLLADRRFAYAEASLAAGDAVAARDLYAQTLELAPNWPPARLGLARALLTLGDPAAAIGQFRALAAQDPEDRLGARAFLARLQAAGGAITRGYVAALFDDYAPRFDRHLTEALEYRVPDRLAEAIGSCAGARVFRCGLDLGCGTGLMAKALVGRVEALHGVDLSQRMLDLARRSGLYARLEAEDCALWLMREPDCSADLVLAADVFCYIEDLAPIFVQVRRVLEPSGLFAFSIQSGETEPFRVGADLRVHHAPAHIRDLVGKAGFEGVREQALSLRQDAGKPVPGSIFVAQARSPG